VERLEEEVKRDIEVLKREVERDVEALRKLEAEIEHEVEEYILHPLRDTAARFSAYAHYLAYSSDFGESFRIVAPTQFVNITYFMTGFYCLSDVVFNAVHEYQSEALPDWGKVGLTAVHAGTFQLLASLVWPFLVIHTAVHTSEKHIFTKMAEGPMRRWGPSAVALCLIPFLPLVDEPVERAVDYVFDHMIPHSRQKKQQALRIEAADAVGLD